MAYKDSSQLNASLIEAQSYLMAPLSRIYEGIDVQFISP